MSKLKKILLTLIFTGIFLSSEAREIDFPVADFPFTGQQEPDRDKSMSIEVTINHTSKVLMEDVPDTGYLEVYSILGQKVTSVNLKDCIGGCYIQLAKGIYILKAGKVAKKIIVR